MLFTNSNYADILKACREKKEIEFSVSKDVTMFASGEAPDTWIAYPPILLPPEGYAQVFALTSSDARGALIRLEIVVFLDGGKILYKKSGSDLVKVKTIWPEDEIELNTDLEK